MVIFIVLALSAFAGLVAWVVAYAFLLRFFMPRIRARSKARAAARAMVTGQLVDTVTNIKTVKLFAHDDFEDQAALGAMSTYRDRFISFGRVASAFRLCLMALAGTLPVLLVGLSVALMGIAANATQGDADALQAAYDHTRGSKRLAYWGEEVRMLKEFVAADRPALPAPTLPPVEE